MSRQDEEINELNTIGRATLGRSEIHGIGVFALRAIFKGQQVYADRMPKLYHIPIGSLNKLFPEVKNMILERWPLITQGQKFAFPDARLVSFMNHGEEENYDPVTDTAIKDIPKGAEILENYCRVPDAEKIYPWLNCKQYGIIKL